MKWRKKTLLMKTEAVYGTDSVPTGALNAFLAFDVELNPLAHEEIERDQLLPYYGGAPSVIAGEHVSLSFSVELTPSGTVDGAPPWSPVPRSSGFAETITVTTGPVEYDPVSDGEESASIYVNIDGTRHVLLGFRGKSSLEFNANAIPMQKIEGVGLLTVMPAAAALPVIDLAAWKTGRDISKTNTPTFTIDGYAAVLQSLSIDLGQEAVYRNRVNAESVEITGRKVTGSLTIDAPDLATKDFFALAKADPPTPVVLQLIHGAGAGNIVQIDAPKVQILPPSYTDDSGITGLQMGLKFLPDAGDDEIKITVK